MKNNEIVEVVVNTIQNAGGSMTASDLIAALPAENRVNIGRKLHALSRGGQFVPSVKVTESGETVLYFELPRGE